METNPAPLRPSVDSAAGAAAGLAATLTPAARAPAAAAEEAARSLVVEPACSAGPLSFLDTSPMTEFLVLSVFVLATARTGELRAHYQRPTHQHRSSLAGLGGGMVGTV